MTAAPVLTAVCKGDGQWILVGAPVAKVTDAHLAGFHPNDEARLLVEAVGDDGSPRQVHHSIRLGDLLPTLSAQDLAPAHRRRRQI